MPCLVDIYLPKGTQPVSKSFNAEGEELYPLTVWLQGKVDGSVIHVKLMNICSLRSAWIIN